MKKLIITTVLLWSVCQAQDSAKYYLHQQQKFSKLAMEMVDKYYITDDKYYWDEAWEYFDSFFRYYHLGEDYDHRLDARLEKSGKSLERAIKETKLYFTYLGMENDKSMFSKGYTKAIDSLPIYTRLESVPSTLDINSHKDNYMLSDSLWFNKDSTYFIFRYYKKSTKLK